MSLHSGMVISVQIMAHQGLYKMMLKTFLAGSTALLYSAAFIPTVASAADTAPLKVKSVEFTASPAPVTDLEKVAPYTTSAAVATRHRQLSSL